MAYFQFKIEFQYFLDIKQNIAKMQKYRSHIKELKPIIGQEPEKSFNFSCNNLWMTEHFQQHGLEKDHFSVNLTPSGSEAEAPTKRVLDSCPIENLLW